MQVPKKNVQATRNLRNANGNLAFGCKLHCPTVLTKRNPSNMERSSSALQFSEVTHFFRPLWLFHEFETQQPTPKQLILREMLLSSIGFELFFHLQLQCYPMPSGHTGVPLSYEPGTDAIERVFRYSIVVVNIVYHSNGLATCDQEVWSVLCTVF